MKTVLGLVGVALAIAAAGPAAAALVEYSYNGSVAAVFGPAPDGVAAGDAAHVRLRFDSATLVDRTAVANAAFGTFYSSLKVGSLTGPGALLDVRVGPSHFTGADQFDFFGDPLVAGGNPYVLFKDGGFFGVQFFAMTPGGSAFATAGASPQLFDFVGGAAKVGGPSYGGFFDYSKAVVSDVPEPSTWALLIGGFALTGAALRRRRDSVAA